MHVLSWARLIHVVGLGLCSWGREYRQMLHCSISEHCLGVSQAIQTLWPVVTTTKQLFTPGWLLLGGDSLVKRDRRLC